ncbi:MAG: hypothetical protein JSV10_08545 [Candidatus Zixiibacteriota bacterium]|nr:MAG: hypothetical protein JSV10_08545 [candidate division Zixibacteria bacterium]
MIRLIKLNLLLAVGLALLLSTASYGQFVRTLGGSDNDFGNCVIETWDGGFVVTGFTESFGAGSCDLLLAKFDASGNMLWTETVGGANWDNGRCVIEASDRGLVVVGGTYTYSAGYDDFLLAKFDSSGNHLWTRTIGGTDRDYGLDLTETSDGGLVVMGDTWSFGAGYCDWLLAKFDASGNLLWTKTLGGSSHREYGRSVIETFDGGLVATGHTFSFQTWGDLLLAKFDSMGNHLWTRNLGGELYDAGNSVIQASDGGLVVTGHTKSFGAGNFDLFLVKFDTTGNHLWSKTLGGSGDDRGKAVKEVSGGGLIVIGYTDSFSPGDTSLFLAKFDSSGNHLWTRTLQGAAEGEWYSVAEASDGALVLTTETHISGGEDSELLLAKFDASGNTCMGEFVTPTITSPSPTVATPSPTITAPSPTIGSPTPALTWPSPTASMVCTYSPKNLFVGDVEDDQGKQVRVKWDRCHYDTAGSAVTITEYGVWRRNDGSRAHVQGNQVPAFDFGESGKTRLSPPGDWELVETVPAAGESTYTTVCSTLVDSTQAGGMYWSVFFVSAMTPDPLVCFDSDPDSGYSLDNIPPLPIQDLQIDSDAWFTLKWTVPGEYVGEQPISSYDIRYSIEPVSADTQAWWDDATPCAGDEFFNLVVGEEDSLQVMLECSCHPELYIAIKGLDDRPNASGISNVVHFLCGDDNGDGIVNIGDVVYEVVYLYKNGPAPSPKAAGDANCDGMENIGDIVYKVSYLYRGGRPPCDQY